MLGLQRLFLVSVLASVLATGFLLSIKVLTQRPVLPRKETSRPPSAIHGHAQGAYSAQAHPQATLEAIKVLNNASQPSNHPPA